MTRNRRISVSFIFLALIISTTSFSLQGVHIDAKFRAQQLNLTVSGTSTLHDWDMKSNKGQCELVFQLSPNETLVTMAGLNFTVPAESLKSHSSMMDNNTYKALKTGAHKTITFVHSSGSVTKLDATTFQIRSIGKLTIAGTTKETELVATAKYNAADKSYTITGSKKMKMTDWGVKPPTVMMGTIKTGNDITIEFNAKIVR